MQDIILALVQPLAEWTVRPVWRQLSYVFHYKSNIEHLNEQVLLLRDKRDGVKLDVADAGRALKVINPGVDRWIGDVDKIIVEEETSFSEETVAAEAACYNGWLPNLKCRHYLGRKAKKMTEKVDKLVATAPTTIAHPAPHPEVEFQPTEDSTQLGTNLHEGASSSSGTSHHGNPHALLNFDSRRSTVGEVMEALRRDQINPIIICGMGGIGKTTLMGQVVEKAKQEGLFDEYTKATFKESLNKAADLCVIQDELARYLGLELQGKETDARASKLRQRLSQGSKETLVMLDNVWTTTPDFLWEIGIPHSCKLLVTSRQQDLFKNMDTRKNFPIHGLSAGDAWSLFKKTAGSSIESDPELQVVAKKVLKECAGLPMAISTVGTALNGERIMMWENALRELEKACPDNVPGVIEHVYGKIKLSYECLPSEQTKLCFLLCSVCCIHGESNDVSMEDLVRYGLGLGFFKGIDSVVEGRNRVGTLVQTLKSRFLLLESYKKECVKMHDVVRDVAVYIATEELVKSKNDGVGNRIVVRDKAETVKLMDLPEKIFRERSTYCTSLSVSGLSQLLLLEGSWGVTVLPPTIFSKMKDLKVLAIMYTVLPPLAVLNNLQTLRLEGCYFECDVSVIGELKTLMILSLRESDITRLPDTFKSLSCLRLLDLTSCWRLEVISPGVISSLYQLEELYMWNSFQDWAVEKLASSETSNWISQFEAEIKKTTVEAWQRFHRLAVEQPIEIGKQFRKEVEDLYTANEEHTRWANSMDWNTGILAELLTLSRLTTLQVVLPPINELLSSSLFDKLERFKISVGWKEHFPDWKFKHDGNYLRVHDLDESAAVGRGITSLLEKASVLEFKLTRLQLVNVLDTVCFAKIKSLRFDKCDAVEYLIDMNVLVKPTSTPLGCSGVFPVLNALEISGASRLKEIFHGELPTRALNELRSLELSGLPALTYIWKTKRQSDQWGSLRNILGLIQVLKIEECESMKEIVAFEDDEEEINFQSLTELTLSSLSSFTGITKSTSKEAERLPEDSSLEQSDAATIRSVFAVLNMLDFNVSQQSLFHTKEFLQSLFDTKVHFPVLTKLKIKSMNLIGIWNIQVSEESFCELKTLWVERCHELLCLVPTHMQNRLQKLDQIRITYCASLEEIFEHRKLIVDDAGDAAAVPISESENQVMQINKMVSFKQSHQAFQNLTVLSVYLCNSLTSLISPSIGRGLVKLQRLEISDCWKIEEIVAAAEGEETEDDNMFPQLCTLSLGSLHNLIMFSQGKYNFKWPLLEAITILSCYKMKNFCLGSLSIPRKVKMSVDSVDRSFEKELYNSMNIV